VDWNHGWIEFFWETVSFCWIYTFSGICIGNMLWISIIDDYYPISNLDISLSTAYNVLSVATNAVMTMMIMYKVWLVSVGRIHWIQLLTMKWYCRTHCSFIVKTLGLSGRKSPAQTILILLIESGLVFLRFQVSDLYILLIYCCARSSMFSLFWQIVYTALYAVSTTADLDHGQYVVGTIYVSLAVSVWQTEGFHDV